ncbi:MAG: DUF4465 domain-containing protein [Puniceicoccaceae bacterium]
MKTNRETGNKRWVLLAAGILLPAMMQGDRPLTLQVGFEDLALGGDGVQTYDGPGGGIYYNGSDGQGGFVSEGAFFANTFTDWGGGFTSWGGWAYSTTSDVETGGFLNEFSAIAGGPAQGTTYAVAYVDSFSGLDPLEIALPAGWKAPQQVTVTNTTYAALAIRDGISGDFPVEPFSTDDTFKLTITGKDRVGATTGTVEFYLADYRGEGEASFLLETWQPVDLSALGTGVASLALSLESTDVGQFGMNTPAYVAIDDLILGATPLWARFDQDASGWVDTGAFLGWIYPESDFYAYVLSLGRYVYLTEAAASSENGAWIYVPRGD